MILLEQTLAMITSAGFQIGHIDATIITQAPQMRPYILTIRQSLADCLHLTLEDISVKAKTTEGLGFIGRGEGMVALATATLLPL